MKYSYRGQYIAIMTKIDDKKKKINASEKYTTANFSARWERVIYALDFSISVKFLSQVSIIHSTNQAERCITRVVK